ncbi:hypothetical protein [Vineibacter terrae]|uniref:hypothetical protein n=1 Tax=Vineibacter terrae TaxID=2586908 RepID=UPI002E37CF35|nr:hypothetical protein [Vineibacter terrae]HEX2887181.1 hypothetical protein [Vineibacter terrae]
MSGPLPVFIGFDAREAPAFDVCRHSLLRHASIPLHVQALRQANLRARGLHARRAVERDGQQVDELDGRPFGWWADRIRAVGFGIERLNANEHEAVFTVRTTHG